MDSRATQSHAHEHHNLGSQQQVAHGAEEHHDEHEKKSVLKKVKAKAKKIKDTITKHGHHDHDQEHGHGYHYEDQHIPDDHDLDEEDDEDVQDPEIHGAPIYDSAAVRNVTPGQVKKSGAGVNFGGATVMGEPHHEPRKVVVSPASDINQSRINDPARTFVREDNRAVHPKVNLERPMELEEDPHAPGSRVGPYSSANYETKVTDPTRAGGAEIDISPVERSLGRMAVQNEPKPIPEPKILPTIAENQYPSVGNHHQFTPELSTATKTPYPSTAISHDQNLPELSSEIKTQYPRSHGQFTPDLSTSIQTQYPSSGSHDQFTPQLSTEHKPPYPSATIHDQNLPLYSTPINPSAGSHGHDQFITETKPQHTSATSHGQYLPQHSTPMKTQYPSGVSHDLTPQFPIATSHDQNLPPFSSELNTLYPSNIASHDHFGSELRTGNVPQHSFPPTHDQNLPHPSAHPIATSHGQNLPHPSAHSIATSYDQNLPHHLNATRTQYPSAGSHDQFTPELPNEHRPQHSFPASHDHPLPQYSSATQTQYPSVRSHDHFTPELQREAKSQHSIDTSHNQNLPQHSKTEYPSSGSHDQFTPQFSDNRGNMNTTTVEEQQQSNPSNSYTDTIYLATAALADKAVTAKNAVASKLGYGENENEARSGENASNQGSSYTEKMSSVTSSIADKAATAKDTVSSKLGYGGTDNVNETRIGENQPNQSNQSGSYTDTVYLATAAIADKAVTAKNAVASKLGYGENENQNVNITTRTGETPQNQRCSYTEKISSATPSIADKATAAKNAVASKLGYGENENVNVNETRINENPQNQNSSYTEKISSATSSIADKAVSAKNTVASKLGFGEKDERNLENSSATSAYPATSASSATSAKSATFAKETPGEYGKRIAVSLTEKLAPVYGKAGGVGSAVKSKGESESGVLEQDKGVSMKDYLAEKLRPGEDDVALSEMISENLYKGGSEGDERVYEEGKGENVNVRKVVSDAVHKRGDYDERREVSRPRGKVTESEEVKRRLGGWDDERKEESEKTVADKVKDVVGSWFGTSGENQNQSTQGSGVVSKNSDVEVEHVNEGVGGRRLHESTN